MSRWVVVVVLATAPLVVFGSPDEQSSQHLDAQEALDRLEESRRSANESLDRAIDSLAPQNDQDENKAKGD